jgi:hypothetical protein
MISDSSQNPLHMAVNSDQSENSAAPATRKPWKTPHMIVSDSSDAESNAAGASDGGVGSVLS